MGARSTRRPRKRNRCFPTYSVALEVKPPLKHCPDQITRPIGHGLAPGTATVIPSLVPPGDLLPCPVEPHSATHGCRHPSSAVGPACGPRMPKQGGTRVSTLALLVVLLLIGATLSTGSSLIMRPSRVTSAGFAVRGCGLSEPEEWPSNESLSHVITTGPATTPARRSEMSSRLPLAAIGWGDPHVVGRSGWAACLSVGGVGGPVCGGAVPSRPLEEAPDSYLVVRRSSGRH